MDNAAAADGATSEPPDSPIPIWAEENMADGHDNAICYDERYSNQVVFYIGPVAAAGSGFTSPWSVVAESLAPVSDSVCTPDDTSDQGYRTWEDKHSETTASSPRDTHHVPRPLSAISADTRGADDSDMSGYSIENHSLPVGSLLGDKALSDIESDAMHSVSGDEVEKRRENVMALFAERERAFREQFLGIHEETTKKSRQSVGLDHLDNLVRIMQQLSQLRDENAQLRRRCVFLHNTRSLLRIQNDMMAVKGRSKPKPHSKLMQILSTPVHSRPRTLPPSRDFAALLLPEPGLKPAKLRYRSQSMGSIDMLDAIDLDSLMSKGEDMSKPRLSRMRDSKKSKRSSKWTRMKNMFSGKPEGMIGSMAVGHKEGGMVPLHKEGAAGGITAEMLVKANSKQSPSGRRHREKSNSLMHMKSVEAVMELSFQDLDDLGKSPPASTIEPLDPAGDYMRALSETAARLKRSHSTPSMSSEGDAMTEIDSIMTADDREEWQPKRSHRLHVKPALIRQRSNPTLPYVGTLPSSFMTFDRPMTPEVSYATFPAEDEDDSSYVASSALEGSVVDGSNVEYSGLEGSVVEGLKVETTAVEESGGESVEASAIERPESGGTEVHELPVDDAARMPDGVSRARSPWDRVKEIIHTRRDSLRHRNRGDGDVIALPEGLADSELGQWLESKIKDQQWSAPHSPSYTTEKVKADDVTYADQTPLPVDVLSRLSGLSEDFHKKMQEWHEKKQRGHLLSTDAEKAEANFSEDFILKMEEWERMKGRVCSMAKPRSSSMDTSTCSPRSSTPTDHTQSVTPVSPPPATLSTDETPHHLSESFTRTVQQWERIRERRVRETTSPPGGAERTATASSTSLGGPEKRSRKQERSKSRERDRSRHKFEKERQKIERKEQKIEKERQKLEKLKLKLDMTLDAVGSTSSTSGAASGGDGLSDEFKRKLQEWEVAKGLANVEPHHTRSHSEKQTHTMVPVMRERLRSEGSLSMGSNLTAADVPDVVDAEKVESSEVTPPAEDSVSSPEVNTVPLCELEDKAAVMAALEHEKEQLTARINWLNMEHRDEIEKYRRELWATSKLGRYTIESDLLSMILNDLRDGLQQLREYSDILASEKQHLETKTIEDTQARNEIESILLEEIEQIQMTLDRNQLGPAHKDMSEHIYEYIKKVQKQLGELKIGIMERNQVIEDMERHLLVQEVTNKLLEADNERRGLELQFFRRERRTGVLKRWRTFGGRDIMIREDMRVRQPNGVRKPPSDVPNSCKDIKANRRRLSDGNIDSISLHFDWLEDLQKQIEDQKATPELTSCGTQMDAVATASTPVQTVMTLTNCSYVPEARILSGSLPWRSSGQVKITRGSRSDATPEKEPQMRAKTPVDDGHTKGISPPPAVKTKAKDSALPHRFIRQSSIADIFKDEKRQSLDTASSKQKPEEPMKVPKPAFKAVRRKPIAIGPAVANEVKMNAEERVDRASAKLAAFSKEKTPPPVEHTVEVTLSLSDKVDSVEGQVQRVNMKEVESAVVNGEERVKEVVGKSTKSKSQCDDMNGEQSQPIPSNNEVSVPTSEQKKESSHDMTDAHQQEPNEPSTQPPASPMIPSRYPRHSRSSVTSQPDVKLLAMTPPRRLIRRRFQSADRDSTGHADSSPPPPADRGRALTRTHSEGCMAAASATATSASAAHRPNLPVMPTGSLPRKTKKVIAAPIKRPVFSAVRRLKSAAELMHDSERDQRSRSVSSTHGSTSLESTTSSVRAISCHEPVCGGSPDLKNSGQVKQLAETLGSKSASTLPTKVSQRDMAKQGTVAAIKASYPTRQLQRPKEKRGLFSWMHHHHHHHENHEGEPEGAVSSLCKQAMSVEVVDREGQAAHEGTSTLERKKGRAKLLEASWLQKPKKFFKVSKS